MALPVRARRGFTLIELMVTLAVLAVLVAMAFPSFSAFMEKARLRAAADALLGQLALARSEAVRSDRNVLLNIIGEDGSWCSGARQFQAGGILGLTEASGSEACDCSEDASTCLVAGNSSVVDSASFAGVVMSGGDGTTFEFDRKTGTLLDLVPVTIGLRSNAHPSMFGLNIVTTPMGHARACIPDGFASFGSYRPC